MTTMTNLARRCTSSPVGRHRVESMTQANKKYDLTIDEFGKHTCSCPAFAFKRNKMGGLSALGQPGCSCKHVDAFIAVNNGCGWNSTTGETPQVVTICPRCFNDTEEYSTEDPSTVDLDDLMARYKALQQRLKG